MLQDVGSFSAGAPGTNGVWAFPVHPRLSASTDAPGISRQAVQLQNQLHCDVVRQVCPVVGGHGLLDRVASDWTPGDRLSSLGLYDDDEGVGGE